MFRTKAIAASAAAIAVLGCGIAHGEAAPGSQSEVMFTAMTPLSRNSEMARRLWPPVRAAQLQRELARAGKTLSAQPLAISAEHCAVYVPQEKPANGYGLLVYIAPGNAAQLPSGWGPVLDRYGVI